MQTLFQYFSLLDLINKQSNKQTNQSCDIEQRTIKKQTIDTHTHMYTWLRILNFDVWLWKWCNSYGTCWARRSTGWSTIDWSTCKWWSCWWTFRRCAKWTKTFEKTVSNDTTIIWRRTVTIGYFKRLIHGKFHRADRANWDWAITEADSTGKTLLHNVQ